MQQVYFNVFLHGYLLQCWVNDEESWDSEDFCEIIQYKKSNKISVCNNLQHILYNSNDLFDKLAKTV